MNIPAIPATITPRNRIAALGPVMQLAYVPQDIWAAAKYWVEVMGAGPFYHVEHVKVDELKYKGQPAEVDFSMLIGHWGDMQIELIQQHNDTASIYTDWLRQGRQGVHHVCVLVDDMAHARKVVAESGSIVMQEGKPRGGAAEVIYVDVPGGGGTMVEILTRNEGLLKFFAHIREAARNWDGSDPIRKPGR